jgi:hypothetical protein
MCDSNLLRMWEATRIRELLAIKDVEPVLVVVHDLTLRHESTEF